jgi:hypothetical protein
MACRVARSPVPHRRRGMPVMSRLHLICVTFSQAMTTPPPRLKTLLRERRWQTYRTFQREYDKAAQSIDSALVRTWPSRAQFARWLSGDLKGLPYPDHCRVLEKMLPGWTAEQLFEKHADEQSTQAANGSSEPARSGSVGQLVHLIGGQLGRPELGDAEWGPTAPGSPIPGESLVAALTAPDTDEVSDEARQIAGRLLELPQTKRLGEHEVWQLAGLAGCVIELSRILDIEISPEGKAHLTYRFDLLNMSSKPLTRVTREVWFKHGERPLVIAPTPDSERRVVIQRIHDTSNLAKFAFQISPPLKPGESTQIGYICDGGKFVDEHYWREEISHYTRHYALRVRQQDVQLGGCSATEEQPDGAENSAADGLTWDYDDDGITLTLTRDYLRPKQAATLRWEVIRASA